jgi:hypothetical protein
MRNDVIMFIVVAVGLGVAAGLSLWRWRTLKGSSLARGALELGIVLAIAAAAGVLTHRLIPSSHEADQNVEPSLSALKQTPLLRLLFVDVPGAEELMRSAMDEDVRSPVQSGPTRALTQIVKLRGDHIVPALLAADDKAALAAIAARLSFIRHLQAKDLIMCREFALVGVQRVDKLDSRGQELFQATLVGLEDAYRSGRKPSGAVPPKPTDADVRQMLVEAGFQPDDLDKLKRLHAVADVEVCALAARLNTAPTQIAPAKAGSLARHLLTSQ